MVERKLIDRQPTAPGTWGTTTNQKLSLLLSLSGFVSLFSYKLLDGLATSQLPLECPDASPLPSTEYDFHKC